MIDREHDPLSRNEIVLIRELIKTTIDERDRRYEDRFRAADVAVNAALSAQDKSVSAAFAASEKAIVKAETAQTAYNERSNEFRKTLDDQARLLISKSEADSRYTSIDKTIEEIKARTSIIEQRLAGGAGKETEQERDKAKWILYIGMTISFIFSLIATVVTIIKLLKG